MEYRVSGASMMMMSVALVAGVVIPVVLFLLMRFKGKCKVAPFFVGCATFALFACVLEQMLHAVVLNVSPLGGRILGNIWLYALYGALAAGVFEETGRFLAMKYALKKYHGEDRNALMYGAGHGGFEVLYVLGLGMFSNLVMAFTINSGLLEAQLSVLPEEVYDQTIAAAETLSATAPWMFGVGIVERLMALAAHMAFSVVVWIAATRGRSAFFYYPVAILMHFVLDFAVVLSNAYFGIWAAEFATLAITIVYVYLARTVYRKHCVTAGGQGKE